MDQYGKVVDIYNWGITGITHFEIRREQSWNRYALISRKKCYTEYVIWCYKYLWNHKTFNVIFLTT